MLSMIKKIKTDFVPPHFHGFTCFNLFICVNLSFFFFFFHFQYLLLCFHYISMTQEGLSQTSSAVLTWDELQSAATLVFQLDWRHLFLKNSVIFHCCSLLNSIKHFWRSYKCFMDVCNPEGFSWFNTFWDKTCFRSTKNSSY